MDSTKSIADVIFCLCAVASRAASATVATFDFSSAASFSLQSIEVTKAWANGFTHFEGYVGNTLTYQMNVFSTTSGPTHARFDWSNLNKVIMSDGNQTYQSVIDNHTINAAAVPEPATGATMLAGLAMIAFMVRRVREPKPGQNVMSSGSGRGGKVLEVEAAFSCSHSVPISI